MYDFRRYCLKGVIENTIYIYFKNRNIYRISKLIVIFQNNNSKILSSTSVNFSEIAI